MIKQRGEKEKRSVYRLRKWSRVFEPGVRGEGSSTVIRDLARYQTGAAVP
jgi:hypothetical protein